MSTVAREAGLGSATLYRHFASREMLLAAVFRQELEHCSEILEAALADPDPWRGMRDAVESLIEIDISSPGFSELIISRRASLPGFEQSRDALIEGLRSLVTRLREHGATAPDFTLDDLLLVLIAVRAVVHNDRSHGRRRGRRVLDLFSSSIRKR
jgi:AcrR family transcriptional regulator